MAEQKELPHGQGDGVCCHFIILTYGIQSHINLCRVLARRLVHLHDEDGSGDPASSRASSHGYDELIDSHAADPAFEVTLPGKVGRDRRISLSSQCGEAGVDAAVIFFTRPERSRCQITAGFSRRFSYTVLDSANCSAH
jgi:hypothetical protein